MSQKTHFQDRSALEHVAQMRAKAIRETAEAHGTEIPGHLSAAADAAREAAVALTALWMLTQATFWILIVAAIGLTVWKTGRSAWLGWARLERLHRIIEQERWEIEHHRAQEREELEAMYRAKGFEGELLTEVVDVLMADGDRLLAVMLEEELGLSLQAFEHPLKQCLGAAVGSLLGSLICIAGFVISPFWGLTTGCVATLMLAGWTSAHFEGNRLLPAFVWHLAIGGLALGVIYFCLQMIP